MIIFNEKKETNTEIFKESKLSLCHTCKKIDMICNLVTLKICGTDSKINKAYVATCASYENSDSKGSSFDPERGK